MKNTLTMPNRYNNKAPWIIIKPIALKNNLVLILHKNSFKIDKTKIQYEKTKYTHRGVDRKSCVSNGHVNNSSFD
jgi:CO dehydrogenase/acetyl-CoA synthase alpha subunit